MQSRRVNVTGSCQPAAKANIGVGDSIMEGQREACADWQSNNQKKEFSPEIRKRSNRQEAQRLVYIGQPRAQLDPSSRRRCGFGLFSCNMMA